MILTVAICTWNRCQLLSQALEAMTKLIIPKDVEWELLVVNNNCTDNTDKVIAAFSEQLPIRRIFEPKSGKSHALNTAVRESKGEYILWTDDDAIVDENWVTEYCKAFQKWPDAAFFGGPALPVFEKEPPEWLSQSWPHLRHYYACPDYGPDPMPFKIGELPYGVNFAIQSIEQKRVLYDVRFGLRPGSEMRAEDFVLVSGLIESGVRGYWVPTAKVKHHVPSTRLTTKWLRKRAFGAGESMAMFCNRETHKIFFGRPLWLWRRLITAEISYPFFRLFSKPDIWIKYLVNGSIVRGTFFKYGKIKMNNGDQ